MEALNTKATPQQIKILTCLDDGYWHCSSELASLFIVDYRSQINKLRKHGFNILDKKCDGNCGRMHESKKMNMWSWPQSDRMPDIPSRRSNPEAVGKILKPSKAWKFQSKSRPEVKYTVVQFGYVLQCDCPGYFRRSHCVHIDEVLRPIKEEVKQTQGTLL